MSFIFNNSLKSSKSLAFIPKIGFSSKIGITLSNMLLKPVTKNVPTSESFLIE